jgi:predicted outer membrane lipoprotein
MALSRTGRLIMLSLLGSAMAGLVLNSVINVREYDDPLRLIMQRTMVQPVELWWMTWKDIGVGSHPGPAAMWNSLFVNPIDPARNTSIQALMLINVGDDRTRELLAMGQQYAGGYPEVLFELFGPYLALPVAAAFGLVTALLLRLVVTATCQGRAFTALLALYVYFGFSLMYIGGMLNFLLAWTFWLKLLALAVACAIERPHGARTAGAGRARTLRPFASSASSQTP